MVYMYTKCMYVWHTETTLTLLDKFYETKSLSTYLLINIIISLLYKYQI